VTHRGINDPEKDTMNSWLRLSVGIGALAGLTAACTDGSAVPERLATGYVEATDVRVAARVAGRVTEVRVVEGATVRAGDVVAVLATTELDLAVRRLQAERAQAEAQLRLLRAGARTEDIDQAVAQAAMAASEIRAAETERDAARNDEARFDQLLAVRAGSVKQRDDARTRRELADARIRLATDRLTAANAAVSKLRAGARAEEVDGARARVAAVEAQLASLDHDRADATVLSPLSGIVTARMVEPGELVSPGSPLAVIVDLEHAWVNAYVEAPKVPSLKIGQAVTVATDGGDTMPGTIATVSPRAEFTPRNVQTAAERERLVYRVKVTVDNRAGVLKPGMPVEVR
jgi:HlyD family secretion protein